MPASGIPASGIPAGGKSTGDGWGGEARGAGNGKKAPQFTAQFQPAPLLPEEKAARRLIAATRQDRIAQLTDNLCDLALNAEREETQVSATVAALNRLEGMPVQRNVNLNADAARTDADIAAELAELDRRATLATSQGDVVAPVPPRSSGILH